MSEPAVLETARKFSVKKTVGVVGSLCFYAIAAFGIYKDPSQAPAILWPVGAYTAALFGIKTFSGASIQREAMRSNP